MTAVEGLIFVVVLIAMTAAAACELATARWATPQRRLRSWLMWGAVGATLTGIAAASTHHGLDAALLSSLAVGLVCQPLGHTLIWLGEQRGVRELLNRDRGSRRRVFSVTIGFWTWPPPPPMPPDPPKARPPSAPAPLWFLRSQAALTAATILAWPSLTVLTDWSREPERRELVLKHLDALAFEGAQVKRALTSAPCWGGVEYDWRSEAGDGRACVRDGEHVTAFVERDRTSKDPFARPGD